MMTALSLSNNILRTAHMDLGQVKKRPANLKKQYLHGATASNCVGASEFSISSSKRLLGGIGRSSFSNKVLSSFGAMCH